jgi:hypothetical protein
VTSAPDSRRAWPNAFTTTLPGSPRPLQARIGQPKRNDQAANERKKAEHVRDVESIGGEDVDGVGLGEVVGARVDEDDAVGRHRVDDGLGERVHAQGAIAPAAGQLNYIHCRHGAGRRPPHQSWWYYGQGGGG